MTPIPLNALGFRAHHHLSALWWLGLAYIQPMAFASASKKISSRLASRRIFVSLILHGSLFFLFAFFLVDVCSRLAKDLIFSEYGQSFLKVLTPLIAGMAIGNLAIVLFVFLICFDPRIAVRRPSFASLKFFQKLKSSYAHIERPLNLPLAALTAAGYDSRSYSQEFSQNSIG